MNILLVHSRRIADIPPVRNLIIVLLRNGHHVTVVAQDDAKDYVKGYEQLRSIVISKPENRLKKAFNYPFKKHRIRKIVKEEMKQHDLLWTTCDTAVRDVGRIALHYKYILQLMELIEDIPCWPIEVIPFVPRWLYKILPLHMKHYAQRAYKVIVAEYNRAHIQKAWWSLKRLPEIWPNKPVEDRIEINEIPANVQKILDKLKQEKRKIILYQGVFLPDRDLEPFAQAIEKYQDEFCLYFMGRDTSYRKYLCDKYAYIEYIPFIQPPFHLLITQYAYIGLLPYKFTRYMHVSVLNALYCAPNKIYEYAKYGVPMLGTDVPGLNTPFSQYSIGYCCENNTSQAVLQGIKKIETHHDELSANCRKFYDSVDLDRIVEKILYEES